MQCHLSFVPLQDTGSILLFRPMEGEKLGAAKLDGLAGAWFEDPEVHRAWNAGHSILTKSMGAAVPTPDRAHVKSNLPVLRPILQRMRRAHLLKVPYMEQLEEQLWYFHALRDTQGQLDEQNLPDRVSADDTSMHLDACGLKKLLSFTRREFLRNHTPTDSILISFILYVCWRGDVFFLRQTYFLFFFQKRSHAVIINIIWYICRTMSLLLCWKAWAIRTLWT